MIRKIWQRTYISASVQDPSELPAPLSCSCENHYSGHSVHYTSHNLERHIYLPLLTKTKSRPFKFWITLFCISWYFFPLETYLIFFVQLPFKVFHEVFLLWTPPSDSILLVFSLNYYSSATDYFQSLVMRHIWWLCEL